MSHPRFDLRQLFESINEARTAQHLSWAALTAQETSAVLEVGLVPPSNESLLLRITRVSR